MADRTTTTARAEAIEGFAAVLAQLRDSVGRPSFRVMAGRSRVISHTTLHEAAQGNRLPSWGTTAEFVKACGADPLDYRERWEQANRAVTSVGVVCSAPGPMSHPARPAGSQPSRIQIDVPLGVAPDSPTQLPAAPPDDGDVEAGAAVSPPDRRRWYAGVGLAAAVVLAAGAGIAWSVAGHDAPTPAQSPRFLPADCPVHQQNPPVAPPQHAGDKASFVADITLPDCAHVAHGQAVRKVWRLKNAGSVPWAGYTLHRIDTPQRRDECQTITDVPIPDTAPGKLVDVQVGITAPATPAFCFVRFKMVDASGKVAFPGSRPVNFQVIVD